MAGIAFALSAALFWAIATRLYRQMSDYWSPVGLATVKSVISVGLFLAWFLFFGTHFWAHDWQTLAGLFVSGIIGIALGDSALFYALYRLGERQTLLIAETAAPVLVVSLAFLLLAESITPLQLAGVVLVVLGVDWVIGLRGGAGQVDRVGILWALLAAACQAFGMLVSRYLLVATDISAEESAFWRLLGAVVILPLWMFLRRETLRPLKPLSVHISARLIIAILLGTFFGIMFLQYAVALLPAGLAQALIATSIIFVTLIGAIRGEIVSRAQWGGVVTAVLGVAVIVL